MDHLTLAIRGLTARIIAARFTRENERRIKMDRLTEKLQKAGGVVARQTAKIEARADGIIARESEIEAKTDKAFTPHETILDNAERGLDGLDRALALVSNDPLGSSGGSSEVEKSADTFPAAHGS